MVNNNLLLPIPVAARSKA